jgi:hypothetical protein
MANRIFLSGIGTEVAVRRSEQGERLFVLLEVNTGRRAMHIKVIADKPLTVNWFKAYRSSRPIFVTGSLCEDDDGLFVRAESVDYARSSSAPSKPTSGFQKLNPLPLEKFVSR